MKNMVKYFLAAFVFSSLIVLISCTGRSVTHDILASKIQYDVPVSNDNPQLDWWINNIEGSKREPFLKRIMEAAEKGEVRVFDYFNNPLTSQQIMAIGSDTVYQTLLRNSPPYEEYDTMIVNSVTYRDVVKIRFMEEWKWNPKSLAVDKKVLAIGPVIRKEIAGESFTQLLFWISLDKGFPGK